LELVLMSIQKSAYTFSHRQHFLLKHAAATEHRPSHDLSGAHISKDILDKTQQGPQQEKKDSQTFLIFSKELLHA